MNRRRGILRAGRARRRIADEPRAAQTGTIHEANQKGQKLPLPAGRRSAGPCREAMDGFDPA